MIRWVFALPMAVIVSLALFSFMAWLVNNDVRTPLKQPERLQFDMLMTQHKEDAVQRRQRTIPKRPKVPPMPTIKQTLSPTQTALEPLTAKIGIPTVEFSANVDVHGVAIQTPTLDTAVAGNLQQAIPLYKVKPQYPLRALRRSIEGRVTLKFDIDETGKVINVQIIDSQPKRIFDRAARKAIRRWKFQPKQVDGKAVRQTGMTQTIEFEIRN
jgi:protein TonB